jgi:hypothetical protein
MKIVPLELKALNELVASLHRHHKPVQGHRFSIGAEHDGKLVGGVSVGRPVARLTDDTESGVSLKASGWVWDGASGGGSWTRESKPDRRQDQPQQPKQRWIKKLQNSVKHVELKNQNFDLIGG